MSKILIEFLNGKFFTITNCPEGIVLRIFHVIDCPIEFRYVFYTVYSLDVEEHISKMLIAYGRHIAYCEYQEMNKTSRKE